MDLIKSVNITGSSNKIRQKRRKRRLLYLKEYRTGEECREQRDIWLRKHPNYYHDWIKKHPDYYKKWRLRNKFQYNRYHKQRRKKHDERHKNYMKSYMREYRRRKCK